MERRAVTLQILSIASECAPFVKTGGLADVVGALPAALAPEGVRVRTLLPAYPALLAKAGAAQVLGKEKDLFGGPARILGLTLEGLDLILIDAPHLYDRAGSIYLGPDGKDWPDNPERFAALSWIGAQIGAKGIGGWQPDLLHCHDWQAGFAPEYLRMAGRPVPSVLTIHNIAFHGYAPVQKLGALRLDAQRFDRDGFEFWGKISALKAGLMAADKLTTVSPSYAVELMREEFGMGMDGVMRHRARDLSGILNGIDTAVWSPENDPLIVPYEAGNLAGKAKNKAYLRKEMGLPESDGPLFCVVSRLTEQKGLDLLLDALPHLTACGGQLALLGSGEKWMEAAFLEADNAHADVAVKIGYDEGLSHRMIAGADAILVPSRFEPCGLTQMYGLRYGTLPVVALTGGLADTVINASPAALAQGVATGLQFHPVTATTLAQAIGAACDLWADPPLWGKMQANAMAQPVDWGPSAAAYARLYRSLAAPLQKAPAGK